MRLLLHICCGPCATYTVKKLQEKFEVWGYFYNPNIYPEEEYQRRKEAAEQFGKQINLPMIWGPYKVEEYFKEIMRENLREDFKVRNEKIKLEEFIKLAEEGKLYLPQKTRCPICYKIRLKATAQMSQRRNFDYFSTTLLISPYQNQEMIFQIGKELARRYGVKFYFQDFTPGFWESKKLSREYNLYRQRYCGCLFSKQEAQKINKEKR